MHAAEVLENLILTYHLAYTAYTDYTEKYDTKTRRQRPEKFKTAIDCALAGHGRGKHHDARWKEREVHNLDDESMMRTEHTKT